VNDVTRGAAQPNATVVSAGTDDHEVIRHYVPDQS